MLREGGWSPPRIGDGHAQDPAVTPVVGRAEVQPRRRHVRVRVDVVVQNLEDRHGAAHSPEREQALELAVHVFGQRAEALRDLALPRRVRAADRAPHDASVVLDAVAVPGGGRMNKRAIAFACQHSSFTHRREHGGVLGGHRYSRTVRASS